MISFLVKEVIWTGIRRVADYRPVIRKILLQIFWWRLIFDDGYLAGHAKCARLQLVHHDNIDAKETFVRVFHVYNTCH